LKRARQAVGDKPRDYRDALWLARFCDAAGEHSDAEKLLLKCLDEAGNAPETWLAWMAHLKQTRQRERGVKDLERLKKELPSALQPLTIARCYEALLMPELADKAYQNALRATPDDLEAWEHAADFYRRADRDDEAVRCYEHLLDPASAASAVYTSPARRQLAVLLAGRDAKRALALLDETLADARVRWFIQNDLKKFEASLRRQPPTADERLMLAKLLESAGKRSEARPILADLTDEQPSAAHVLVRYAGLLIRMGELDDAERVVTRLEKLEPGSQRTREVRAELGRAKSS
jgi:tetratricopeptide (TPR) repeat protein